MYSAGDGEDGVVNLVAGFEARAVQSARAEAVGSDAGALTYAELNAWANRIAHLLAARGVGPQDVVAIAVDRSPGLAAALLGVLKAGATYLPLDPDYPAERLKYMVQDARPRCLITTRELGSRLGGLAAQQDTVLLEETVPGSGDPDPGNPAAGHRAGPDAAAYVIYTSGSTGRPKGVVVTHGALANFLAAMAGLFPLGAGDSVVSTTPVSFDIAGLELFLPLLSGARLRLVPRSVAVDGGELRRRLAEPAPALVQGTPALWQLLREAGWSPADLPGAPRLLCGGEALPQDLADFLDSGGNAEVWNMYGPTETTIWSLAGRVRAGEPVSIGAPIRHTEVYVLDEDLREAGPGKEGELYLAGDGLARGYLGQGALTAQRFVACPFGAPGRRMYRTGDLVRRRADGGIDFLGRADEQVKIRGYRIELGEIEQALRAGGQVAQAKVIVREDRPGVRYLAGYVVPTAGRVPDPDTLREQLREWLPEHMVPTGIEVLDRFPLTPAGKIDRAALPAPGFTRAPGRAPSTPREQVLVELFEEVLSAGRIGADDGFFDLGGNSLLATRLIARVRARLGIELPIRDVFEAPTPAGLARSLDHGQTARSAPHPMPRPDHVPLSYAQQRLWFLHRLEGPSTTYNLPIAVRLDGPLDLPALRAAVDHLVERHESLRTRFTEGPDGAEQVIVPAPAAVEIARHPVSAGDLAAAMDRAAGYLFDLAEEIPVRVDLFSTGETEHVLLLCIHHIASDGWSLAPLARDLSEAYSAFRAGGRPATAPLAVQYADYTLWQRELLGSPDDPDSAMAGQLAYWREALAGAPELLDLPTDRKRPPAASYQGDVVRFDLDARLCDELLALANRHRVSLFMVLQAATATLLGKLGAGTDIPLGSPIAGRPDSALDELVGFFVNTLVLRTDISGDPAFSALLERVREGNLAAYAHQDLPFEYLVEVLNPARSSSHHPLFQVMLVLQNNVEPRWELPGLTVAHETVPTRTAKFDLTVELTERFDRQGRPDGLRGEVEYATDLYDEATVRRLIGYLTRILRQVAADPDSALSTLEILDEADLRVLEQGNATDFDEPAAAFPELLRAQVARTPEATALICGEESLTFAELDRRSNEVAHWLIGRGVGTEDVVGVALRRTPELPVCLLGILKAGAVYLPLDPDYPPDRLGFMLADAAPKALFTTGEVAGRLPDGAADAVPDRLDLDHPRTAELLAAQPKHAPGDDERVRPLSLRNLAYIIYTSGSTGRPKAVAVSHYGIPNLARSYIERFGLNESSRFLQFASINFDPTLCELCCTLLAGAAVILCQPEELLAPDRQQATLARYAPTHITFSPTILGGMSPAALADVPNLMVAGETCPPALSAEWSTGRTMINTYGPTEATVDALYWECGSAGPSAETDSVPIGRPLHNTCIYVLDEMLRPVAPGVVGELYIAGHGLARGYLNSPGLTSHRFVACPYGPPGSRMYRTGDLATRRPDGVVDFVGRVDNQVKLRGMRVEPGEIEAVLAAHPAVAQSAVLIREDIPQHKQLVGYVVLRDAAATPRDPAREAEQVDKWQVIHEQGYREQAALAGQEDFTGWNSSYDNEPIPLEQMREWRSATVDRILELEPGRVLEVGVGSGLILWRVAPRCDAYHGVDFSPAVIEALRERVDEVEELRERVELSCLAAHELDRLAGRRFDTIVINSVAQYFPSARYLVDVIRQSMELLEPGGRIFLGDIRNLALQRTFGTAIALANDAHARESAPVLRQLVEQAVGLESELLLDPAFFARIGREVDAVAGVDLRLKRGHHRNELNDFRYDVVLHKHGTELVDLREAPELSWPEQCPNLETLQELLDGRQATLLRVTGIPNRRVAAEVEAERALATRPDADVRELAAATRRRIGVDPEDVHALAAKLDYDVKLTLSRSGAGCFDAVFADPCRTRGGALDGLYRADPDPDRAPQELANAPHADDGRRKLGLELRRHAAKHLPEHMVPAAVMILDRLPFTLHGKLDVAQLPAADFAVRDVQPPRTPQETLLARLFAEVLGLPEVGVDDRFFDLGGDSIRSLQLVSRARAQGFAITARDVFRYQTVETLVAETAAGSAAPDAAAETADDLPRWLKILATADPGYPEKHPVPPGSTGSLVRALPQELSDPLLDALPAMFHAAPQDIAVAALAPVLVGWRGERIQGAPALLRLDLAAAVTGEPYPVRLIPGLDRLGGAAAPPPELARAVKRIKDQIRSVPGDGNSYARQRTAALDSGHARPEQLTPSQVHASFAELNGSTAPSAETAGYPIRIEARRTPGADGVETTWRWDATLFDEEDIAQLADGWIAALRSLAALTATPELGGLTPSDVDLLRMKQPAINELERAYPDLIEILPLAPLQHGLLLHCATSSGGADPYQGQTLFALDGTLDADRLRAAAEALLARHGTLRAGFVHQGLDEPVQVVRRRVDVPWQVFDLSGAEPEEQQRQKAQILAQDAARRFDLATPPMLRFTLLRMSESRHELLVADHHILLDGWSTPLAFRELFELYRDAGASLPEPVPFRDYLAWVGRQDRTAAAEAWRRVLGGLPGPTRIGRPDLDPGTLPSLWDLWLPAELTAALGRRAARLGVTLNTAMQAAWAVQVGRLTGRDDVVFGVTVSDRPAEVPGIEAVLGLLINTVPLRAGLEPGTPYSALLPRLQAEQIDLLPHLHLGLTDIQRLVGTGQLFDIYYVFQNYPDEPDQVRIPGLRITELTAQAQGVSHYPLGITVIPGERLHVLFGYHPELFDEAGIARIGQSLAGIVEDITREDES